MVPVDEGESQLHQHGRDEREEKRESLPDLVSGGAVRGAEVQRCRGLGREQRNRHKDGAGEAHPHSLHSAIWGDAAHCFAPGPRVHNGNHRAVRTALRNHKGTPPQQLLISELRKRFPQPRAVPRRDGRGRCTSSKCNEVVELMHTAVM
ncbi:hypothetical protein GOODEAATRI_027099 [Goodea atripinnis]|uniref:Uncharacterized protein n=1 Tax=Goodea atripinnis TaxID=208336 RepID=A0ABV0NEX6_9TELE